ncbi:MAG TPA: NAD(P)H-dependent oxidoreductase [Thermoleophilia bacterium]|nr:NAD(P)H-dependent oxidoreductase [Thermoleophilia bacterium]
MNAPQSALLLVGSPKASGSSSESLGTYLLEELEARGLRTRTLHVVKAVRDDAGVEDLLEAVAAADVVVLSFPLYVDCLPAPVIRALELIAQGRAGERAPADAVAGQAGAEIGREQLFAAIAQCGFPEAEHNETALAICREFAEAAGFVWAGGLSMGAGGMVDGRPLREARGMLRSAVRALDLAAAGLAAGRPVTDEAVRLMAKPAFPAFAYRFIANWQWRRELKKQGATAPLDARPFA